MLVKYWKNFKWFLFIPLIVFCFVFKINSVNALANKQYDTISNINNNELTGTISLNGSSRLIFQWDPKTNPNNYEYIGLRISPLYSTSTVSTVNGSSSYMECKQWNEVIVGQSSNYVCASWNSSITNNNNLLLNYGDVGFSGYLTYTGQGGGINSPCFYTPEFDGVFICKYVPNANTLVYYVNSYGNVSMNYKVSLSNQIMWLNSDSVEISNSINGVTIEQQQTNTNLQYIYQYQQDDSVSGSTTQVQGDFSDLAQSFNSELQGVNDLSQLVLMPISLFMDLSTDNCQPLHLQIPYVNMSVDLPCMKAVFNQYFNGLYSIFTTIMSAVICYWVAIKTGALVKEIVDCDNDRIEVVDL